MDKVTEVPDSIFRQAPSLRTVKETAASSRIHCIDLGCGRLEKEGERKRERERGEAWPPGFETYSATSDSESDLAESPDEESSDGAKRPRHWGRRQGAPGQLVLGYRRLVEMVAVAIMVYIMSVSSHRSAVVSLT